MKNFTLWSGKVLGLLLTAFTFNAQAQFCDEAQGGLPGFPSDPACETAVCSIDPFCCETSWDFVCGDTAATLAECSGCVNPGNGGGDPICVAEPIEGVTVCDYDTSSAAYSIVIAEDPFCCNTSWDSLCQTSYEGIGGLPNPDPACAGAPACDALPIGDVTACDYDTASAAYSAVIADDPFCCETAWDSLCQTLYEGIGGLPNPDPACEVAGDCTVEVPVCATDAAAVAEVQAEDPICCNDVWDDICQLSYDLISETCGGLLTPGDCAASVPDCVTDLEAYGITVALEPSCCEAVWDANCQEIYNLFSLTCISGNPDDCAAIIPDCVTDEIAFVTVIASDSFCCETEWDFLCQDAYDELSSSCTGAGGGCTYPAACNFDPAALVDDGSCEFTSCAGCTYPDALNFNPVAVYDDGSCVFDPSDCVDNCPGDFNGDNVVNTSDLLTFLSVFGTICD